VSTPQTNAFTNLVAARTDAQRIADLVAGTPTQDALVLALSPLTVGATYRQGSQNISSGPFNQYLAMWLRSNMADIAPQVMALMDAAVEDQRALADAELASLGLGGGAVTPPSVVPLEPYTGAAGQLFSYQITASGLGDSVTYALVNAPSWLSVNPNTGLVTGTPPTSGSFSFGFTITSCVTNTECATTDENTIDIKITDTGAPRFVYQRYSFFDFPSSMPPNPYADRLQATVGQPFSFTFEDGVDVFNAPLASWSIITTGHQRPTGDVSITPTTMPPGITFNPTTGEISGTPSPATWGSWWFMITVETDLGSAQLSLGLNINQS